MTTSVYPQFVPFRNLPQTIAAARATERLYGVDGQAIVQSYVQKTLSKLNSIPLLPARAKSVVSRENAVGFRKGLVACRADGRILPPRPEVIALPAPKPSPLDAFIAEMKLSMDAQIACVLFCDERGVSDIYSPEAVALEGYTWMASRRSKAWGRAKGAANAYLLSHGCALDFAMRIVDNENKVLFDAHLEPVVA